MIVLITDLIKYGHSEQSFFFDQIDLTVTNHNNKIKFKRKMQTNQNMQGDDAINQATRIA